MHLKSSFPPLVSDQSRVLILGSMPGDRSIAENQYYGHPRNRFWPLIAALCGCKLPKSYSEKTDLLLNGGFALWDVVESANRKGSMDVDIKDETPNAIHELLETHPKIHTVAFNGKTAEQLYRKYHKELKHINYISLPSTSPANASYGFERLMEFWQEIVG